MTCLSKMNLPYAVYGTLRSHEGNDVLWRQLAESRGIGTVANFRLVTHGGFPYALPAEDEITTVEIIEPLNNENAQVVVRSRLDRLEGYPMFYGRHLVTVKIDGGEQTCWMYVPVDHESYADLFPVTNNDWTLHRNRLSGIRGL